MKNIVDVPNLNIELPRNYMPYDKFSEIEEARNQSLLPQEIVEEMIASGEMVCINPQADKKVYMYVDRSGVCDLSCVQFYGEDNNLLFTYPWNGEHTDTHFIPNKGIYSNVGLVGMGCFHAFGDRTFTSKIQVTATESGAIAISDLSELSRPPIVPQTEWSAEMFEYNENRGCYTRSSFRYGALEVENYPYTDELREIREYTEQNQDSTENSPNKDFVGVAVGGDKYLEFSRTNSYVI